MSPKQKRVGIYVRVSTDAQNTDAQRQELEAWAERASHTVMKVYEDAGVSGAKGRDQRPAFDERLKAAVRREVNMIAVWSSDCSRQIDVGGVAGSDPLANFFRRAEPCP